MGWTLGLCIWAPDDGWKTSKRRGKEESEISSFLHLLCPGCTLPDVFSYSSDTKHDFATKPLIAITSAGNNSIPLLLPSSFTWLQQPMGVQALCPSRLIWTHPPHPPVTSTHPSYSRSPSCKVDSSWPLWTETHMLLHQKWRTEKLQWGVVIKIHWQTKTHGYRSVFLVADE